MRAIHKPRGKNHAHRMLEIARTEPHWFWQVSTVNDTGMIPNERLLVEEREIVKQYGQFQGQANFQQEFFCSFESPILGAVYADALQHLEAEGWICLLKIETSMPVHTGWDLGVSDSTAVGQRQCCPSYAGPDLD
jgi:hypothetical protein